MSPRLEDGGSAGQEASVVVEVSTVMNTAFALHRRKPTTGALGSASKEHGNTPSFNSWLINPLCLATGLGDWDLDD
jgi:hypothetical protein